MVDTATMLREQIYSGRSSFHLISVGGSPHVLYVREARAVAEIFEKAMREHPNDPASKSFPNLIMSLRAACDKSDRGHGNQ